MYQIYFLVNEARTKTYVGFSDNFKEREQEHRSGNVKSTKKFGDFRHKILETASSLEEARRREKYWKACSGRKKLKKTFEDLR